MSTTSESTEWINQRNRALIVAGENIVAAKASLKQLEDMLEGTVNGEFPDIFQVVTITQRLRGEISEILIGFVESCAVDGARR